MDLNPSVGPEGEALPLEPGSVWLTRLPLIIGGLAGLSFFGAFVTMLIGFGWRNVRIERSFVLMIFQLLLVFPQFAAFPAFWAGLPVSDFFNPE